jgi:DNA repair protein RadA/Sms
MAKSNTQFICGNCGAVTSRWQGKCPTCSQWNTLAEQAFSGLTKSALGATAGKVLLLSELEDQKTARFSTGIGELDSVLGGGLVPGALVLLGGDPGIGKSTLALQAAVNIAGNNKKVLYISGEESAQQIKLRSARLESSGDLLVFPETNLETIVATLIAQQPTLAVIDSIQTISSGEVSGVVGGVSQVAFATNTLMRVAKQQHTSILIIGHVTKDGMLAGPKTLEHMVDVVLYLEGERFLSLRLLRSSKNRFGSSGEVGVFAMTEQGMIEVKNPSAMFLENRLTGLPGSCAAAILEGNKVLILEIQALTNPSQFGYPRRTTSGFDLNRLQLILAILQKSLQINLSSHDVYVNVAGGFNISERAADLPVALAILSSFKNKALSEGLLAFGEIGLLGEVRGVTQSEKRAKEAVKLGFSEIVSNTVTKGLKTDISQLSVKQIIDVQKLF